jgi:ATP-binding cassette subfamily F protein 3
VNTAFYAQHQIEALDLTNEILDELKQAGTGKLEQELRMILGCFLFSGEDVFKPIKVLSGGEKSRVALAKTLISESNFLLLDEPTNHLDIISVNILIQALQQYKGTFILVSHDRHFISEVANKIWFIEDQVIKEYPGTYHEYEIWQNDKNEVSKKTVAEKPIKKRTDTVQKPSSDNKNQLSKLKKNIESLELEIEDIEKERADIETKLADPEIFSDNKKLQETNEMYNQLKKQLQEKNTKWELSVEELDTLE